MILIADSGSTKTLWVSRVGGELKEYVTAGLNPRMTSEEAFNEVVGAVRERLVEGCSERLDSIFFYGAGCGTAEVRQRMRGRLAALFEGAEVEVEGDMLGACRAVCGNERGAVGILGTGSNSCLYDGRNIVKQRVSTGYVLGDEGSGNHIGRRLLKDYLEERMPQDVSTLLHDFCPLTTEECIDRIYRQSYANRFFASFVPFASRHRGHPYVAGVLERCFGEFFDQIDYLQLNQDKPLHLVGGVASEFEPLLTALARRRGITIKTVVQNPKEGLIHYHRL